MKVYECVQVKHPKDIGGMIETWQRNGWLLHTYQATGRDIWINHYLLFERSNEGASSSSTAVATAVSRKSTK